jgi:hypothetical protein
MFGCWVAGWLEAVTKPGSWQRIEPRAGRALDIRVPNECLG